MAQASRKVIVPEADLDEATLATPRFDEAAAQQARPVVPLSGEAGYAEVNYPAQRGARASYLPARKGSWLIAALVGLVLGAGAMAVGVAAYRRNHTVSTRSFVPAAAATMPEINQDFRPRPSSRPTAPAQQTVASETPPKSTDNAPQVTAATTTTATAVAPKSLKRRRAVASPTAENVSAESGATDNDSSGKPRPRLVDRYVMRSSKP